MPQMREEDRDGGRPRVRFDRPKYLRDLLARIGARRRRAQDEIDRFRSLPTREEACEKTFVRRAAAHQSMSPEGANRKNVRHFVKRPAVEASSDEILKSRHEAVVFQSGRLREFVVRKAMHAPIRFRQGQPQRRRSGRVWQARRLRPSAPRDDLGIVANQDRVFGAGSRDAFGDVEDLRLRVGVRMCAQAVGAHQFERGGGSGQGRTSR